MTTAAPSRPFVLAPAALLLAGVAGLAFGGATSWLQGELTGGWYLLADSGAVWTLVAFCIAVLCSGPRWLAVSAGVLSLLAEVAGYYVVLARVHGMDTTTQDQVIWTLAALWIGPLTGLAAHAARRGTPAQAVTALLALTGVIVGEAWHVLVRLGYATAGHAELVAGLGLALVSLVAVRASWPARLGALVTGALVAAAVYAVYGISIG